MSRLLKTAVCLLMLCALVAGCGREDPAEGRGAGLSAAVEQTVEQGNARVELDLPDGVYDTLSVAGRVDFAAERALVTLTVTPDPGAASLPYASFVYDGDTTYVGRVTDPTGAATTTWQRVEPATADAGALRPLTYRVLTFVEELRRVGHTWEPAESTADRTRFAPPSSTPSAPPGAEWELSAATVDDAGILRTIEYRLLSALTDEPAVWRFVSYGDAEPIELPSQFDS